MADSLARRERRALCDLALVLGPEAPTLCEGWDARDLVAHLLVRERHPLGAAGIVLPALAGVTERAMERQRRRDFDALVEKLRSPGLSPFALPPVERAANTMEYVVHHEDLRRGQPDWSPRTLDAADVELVWSTLSRSAGLLGRKAPVPTVLRRSDDDRTALLRKGPDPVVVTGPVVELALFVFGRSATHGLDFAGADSSISALQNGI
jgi:uncharacterized protein (TIGR03085 family)